MGKEAQIDLSQSLSSSVGLIMKENARLFQLFWENSKLNSTNITEFTKRLDEYNRRESYFPELQYSRDDLKLKKPGDDLFRQMIGRKSARVFSEKPVNEKKLGFLMSSFIQTKDRRRTIASAGALYPVEVFCLVNNLKGKMNRKIVYYNCDNHTLSIVCDLPEWKTYKEYFSIDTNSTTPALIFVFVIFPERVTDKYGERGGRFALIEVGHAVQNLALRIAKEQMAGVELGGIYDDRIKDMLKLGGTTAQVVLGYACGIPGRR